MIGAIKDEFSKTADKREKKIFQFTGLSGSGKTTLALEVGKLLQKPGYAVQVPDGDEMRRSICAGLGFVRMARLKNMWRIARHVKENLADVVLIVVISSGSCIQSLAAKLSRHKMQGYFSILFFIEYKYNYIY